MIEVVGLAVEVGGDKLGAAGVALADLFGRLLVGQAQPLAHVGDAVGQRGDDADVERGVGGKDVAGAAAQEQHFALNAQAQHHAGQLEDRGMPAQVLQPQELVEPGLDPGQTVPG